MPQIGKGNPRIQSPRSLPILVALMVLQAIGLIGYGSVQFLAHGDSITAILAGVNRFIPFAVFTGISNGLVAVFLGLINLVIAVALSRLRHWAWIGALALQGVSLIAALMAYLSQRPNYISMVLGVVLVLYLNQSEIQVAFQREP